MPNHKPVTRRRGGQPGNQNARTHGLYSLKLSAHLDPAQADKIDPALNLSEEIVLIRYSLRWLYATLPPDADFDTLCAYIRAVYLATTSINRLVRTQSAITLATDPEMEAFDRALDQAMHLINTNPDAMLPPDAFPPQS
jgi:hypothetical protein